MAEVKRVMNTGMERQVKMETRNHNHHPNLKPEDQ